MFQYTYTLYNAINLNLSLFSNIYHLIMLKTFKSFFSRFLKCIVHYFYLYFPCGTIAPGNFLLVSNCNLVFINQHFPVFLRPPLPAL